MSYKVGTRGSKLALWQTNTVIEQLQNTEIETVIIKSEGDGTNTPLSESKTPGVFVTALRDALLSKEVDFLVHSLKDLPAKPHPELTQVAILKRENSADCLVSSLGKLDELPEGTLVGTSSPRRAASIKRARPDLKVSDIRGNVETRLRKVKEGEYGATVLAYAGLKRLGLEHEITEMLHPIEFIPAPGQGAIVIECRNKDKDLIKILEVLDSPEDRLLVTAERNVLVGLNASCATPIGASAEINNGVLKLSAELSDEITGESTHVTERIKPGNEPLWDAEQLGLFVAERLLANPISQKARLS